MFDILIGTMLKAEFAVPMISQLNPKGFECYELDFNSYQGDFTKLSEHAKQVKEVLDMMIWNGRRSLYLWNI